MIRALVIAAVLAAGASAAGCVLWDQGVCVERGPGVARQWMRWQANVAEEDVAAALQPLGWRRADDAVAAGSDDAGPMPSARTTYTLRDGSGELRAQEAGGPGGSSVVLYAPGVRVEDEAGSKAALGDRLAATVSALEARLGPTEAAWYEGAVRECGPASELDR